MVRNGWPCIVRAISTARGLSFRVDFLSTVSAGASARRCELGDKVRLLELRHSAENLPDHRRVMVLLRNLDAARVGERLDRRSLAGTLSFSSPTLADDDVR
jgi:hypothetical protein